MPERAPLEPGMDELYRRRRNVNGDGVSDMRALREKEGEDPELPSLVPSILFGAIEMVLLLEGFISDRNLGKSTSETVSPGADPACKGGGQSSDIFVL